MSNLKVVAKLQERTLHLCFLPVLALHTLDEPGVLRIICSGLKIRYVTCIFKAPFASLHHAKQLVYCLWQMISDMQQKPSIFWSSSQHLTDSLRLCLLSISGSEIIAGSITKTACSTLVRSAEEQANSKHVSAVHTFNG
jgi:hypothetical protein